MDAATKKNVLIGIAALAGVLLLAALGWFIFQASQFATYKDATYKFSIKYPKAWKMVAAPQPGAAVVFVSPKETALDTFQENVNISITPVPPEIATLKNFSDAILMQMKTVFNNLQVKESREIEIKGARKAARVVFVAEKPDKVHVLNIWTVKGGSSAYILTYMAASSRYEKYLPLVEEMIKSFEIK